MVSDLKRYTCNDHSDDRSAHKHQQCGGDNLEDTQSRVAFLGRFNADATIYYLDYPLRRTSLSIQPFASVVFTRSPSFTASAARSTSPLAFTVIE